MKNHPDHDTKHARALARPIAIAHSRETHEDDVEATCVILDIVARALPSDIGRRLPELLREAFADGEPEWCREALDRWRTTRPASTDATLTHLRAEDYETTADLLSLVMPTPPTAADLREFTVREFVDSDNWAALTHLAASDNNVTVPERPDVLAKFDGGAADS